jgi:hypothetical protein
MRTVFEPSNALEGHMLQDLLQQRGISSRLDGAQLQGGVGELPAAGLVRLVVDDEDYELARSVVDDWESVVGPDPVPAPQAPPAPRSSCSPPWQPSAIACAAWNLERMPISPNPIRPVKSS